jgi:hypothetical protein
MSQDAAVCQLNENARRLLKDFHRLHLSVRGSDYSISFDKDVELVLGLDFPSFKQGAERLVERGLAQRVGHDSYRLTADGVRTAEDERRLDAHLPLRDPETLRQELDVQAEVWRQNGLARNLLALLHEWSLKAAGRPFFVTPNPEKFGRTGLNDETYMQAASRLIAKHLATWAGPPRYVTITDAGIRVAEDEGALRSELPVGPVSAGISGSARSERKIIPMPDKKKVFVIHGRCEPARHEMGVFLRSLGLEPVWFRDVRKNMGGTAHVIKVVERGMAEAHGVLACCPKTGPGMNLGAFAIAAPQRRPLARGRPGTIVPGRETSEAGRPIPISGPSDGRLDPSAAAAGHRVPASREPGAPRTTRHAAPAVH